MIWKSDLERGSEIIVKWFFQKTEEGERKRGGRNGDNEEEGKFMDEHEQYVT